MGRETPFSAFPPVFPNFTWSRLLATPSTPLPRRDVVILANVSDGDAGGFSLPPGQVHDGWRADMLVGTPVTYKRHAARRSARPVSLPQATPGLPT